MENCPFCALILRNTVSLLCNTGTRHRALFLPMPPDQALSPRPNNNVTVEFSSDVYRVNESSRVVIVAVTIETDQAVNLTITSMEKSSQSRAKGRFCTGGRDDSHSVC